MILRLSIGRLKFYKSKKFFKTLKLNFWFFISAQNILYFFNFFFNWSSASIRTLKEVNYVSCITKRVHKRTWRVTRTRTHEYRAERSQKYLLQMLVLHSRWPADRVEQKLDRFWCSAGDEIRGMRKNKDYED